MTEVAFGIVAACMLLAALFSVGSKNLVHGVLWLGATLGMTAILYLMLDAPFLAGVQLLLYVGGVMTLMIFGVMLTRRHSDLAAQREQRHQSRAMVVGVGLFGALTAALLKTEGLDKPAAGSASTADLGRALLSEDLLVFEVISVLLLAALIGAIVLARKKDFAAAPAVPGKAE